MFHLSVSNPPLKSEPAYIYTVRNMVKSMLSYDNFAGQILLIICYVVQKRCCLRLFKSLDINMIIKSMNVSQDKETPFVILDIVTPDATQYTMGLEKEVRRINVALSRAESKLPIAESYRMIKFEQVSKTVAEHYSTNL